MIIGSGQLAKAFQKSELKQEVCIFASGVSNSSCKDINQFERERNLLVNILKNNGDKKFVYFSSCALSASEYPKNDYYKHKVNMENIIKKYSDNYYIFRIPQLFGDLISHKTLINFIYKSIEYNHKFNIYDEAYRYVIEISDVRKLVESYLDCSGGITIDLANPYKYKVLNIVQIFEKLLNKKAHYEVVKKEDEYTLDLFHLEKFVKEKEINITFGEEYLIEKLREKLK